MIPKKWRSHMIFNGKNREDVTCFEYDDYWVKENMDKRLSYDIQKLIPELRTTKGIWDALCGNGKHMRALDSIFSFETLHMSDVSPTIIMDAHSQAPLKAKSCLWDIKSKQPPFINEVDTVLYIDGINNITEKSLRRILSGLKGKKFITRTKVTYGKERGFWDKSELLSILWDECKIVKDRYAYPKKTYGPYIWFFCTV